MKIYTRVCKSLMKKNVSLIIGLFVMSVLTIVIGVLGFNISSSAKDSITLFLNESGLPDKLYTTQICPTSLSDELGGIDGIATVNSRFAAGIRFEPQGKGVFPGNLITFDGEGRGKITMVEEAKTAPNGIGAYVPLRFAQSHEIKPGDRLDLFVQGRTVTATVAGIVSTPESLQVGGDYMAAYEGYSFSNIYLDSADIGEVFGVSGKCNQWLFYFEEGLSEAGQAAAIAKIDEVLGERVVSVRDFVSAKDGLLTYKTNIEAVSLLGAFFSILISLITLGLNFIFIQIIVKKEKRTIGLMKALGYQKEQIVRLFCLLTCLINIPAIIVGFPLGYLVIRLTLYGMQSSFDIPMHTVTVSALSVVGLAAATFLIGVISAVLTSAQISKIEPCDVYGKDIELVNEPVRLVSLFKNCKFFKIVLTSTLRNVGRQVVGALCIAACVLFTFVSLEGYASNMQVRRGVYGERFFYDVAVRNIDGEGYRQIAENLDGIERIEPNIFVEVSTSVGSKRITAMAADAEMIRLHDGKHEPLVPEDGIVIDQFTAERNGLKVGDSITVGDTELRIDGIAIEYTYLVSYVSWETAERLGFGDANWAMIRLEDGYSVEEFTKELADLDKDAFAVRLDDQSRYLYVQYSPIAVALLILGALSFLIGALLVANMAFIDFLELRSKYATLRALGCPMKKISSISLFENATRCVVGCLLALPATYFFGNLLFKLLNTSSGYYVMTKFFTYFLISAAICLVYIAISVLITFADVKKMDFAHSMNSFE